jgi:ATP-binding cassette subfamily C protein
MVNLDSEVQNDDGNWVLTGFSSTLKIGACTDFEDEAQRSAAIILHRYQNTRSQKTAKYAVELEIKANNKVSEMLLAFRELRVRGSKFYFSQEVYNIKLDWARYISRLYFYPSITKFSYEGIILLSAVIIALFQVMDTGASSSISITAIFVAVGFRIAPIALRSQQNFLQIKSNLGIGYSTIEMINILRNETNDSDEGEIETETPEVFEARVDVLDLSLRESGSNLILQDINLKIFAGEKVAIAGASGSGKTSLIEVILGLTPVSTGSVSISGVSPESCFVKFPGSIAYVPQNIFISSGTIRENLAFGFKTEDFSEEDYWHCLRMVKLDLFVNSLPLKLDSQVGELGSSLSGGERQRLAIARALIVHPKLLVIDEGTSALDLITESELSKEILEIGDEVTVIMVAHRISAMRDFNRIIFLQNGTIAGKGNFSELYKTLPQFADTVNKNL